MATRRTFSACKSLY